MATMLFAIPNYIDAAWSATFSGGSWLTALPLTNLRDRRLAKVARSTNAQLTSTKFEVDLTAARTIRVIAIPKHNLSTAAKYRITGSASTPVTGSGDWTDVWPVIYPSGSIAAGHPSYATGKIVSQEAAGYNIGLTALIGGTAGTSYRYWLIEIDDTANSAGYVDLARLVVAYAYQPEINMDIGAQIGYTDSSTSVESPGGAKFFNEGARRRVWTFTLSELTVDLAFANAFELQRKYGTTGQIFCVFDPDDTAHMHRRAYLGVLRQLSLLEYPFADRLSAAFALEEEL